MIKSVPNVNAFIVYIMILRDIHFPLYTLKLLTFGYIKIYHLLKIEKSSDFSELYNHVWSER